MGLNWRQRTKPKTKGSCTPSERPQSAAARKKLSAAPVAAAAVAALARSRTEIRRAPAAAAKVNAMIMITMVVHRTTKQKTTIKKRLQPSSSTIALTAPAGCLKTPNRFLFI